MDAVEFLREKARMCNENPTCNQCELYKSKIACTGILCKKWMEEYPEDAVAFMEKWAKEHPAKTRQSEFLKLFPEADVDKTGGCLTLNPCNVYEKMRKECGGRKCSECRKAFWFTEVEDA